MKNTELIKAVTANSLPIYLADKRNRLDFERYEQLHQPVMVFEYLERMKTMVNKFASAMRKEENWTNTENGALALKSTNSSLVDLFGVIGSLRTANDERIETLFERAFAEDKLLATKVSFYARDVRFGGLGERRTPRIIWKYLANNHPEIIWKNIQSIPLFGRWDDLYEFVGTPVESVMWEYLATCLSSDLTNMRLGKPISLLSKWLKSVNTSSKESRKLGKLTAKKLGYSEMEYRKVLSLLRSYTNVVEVDMTHKNWGGINYEGVPSKAMSNYRNAFKKHDGVRFEQYIEQVSKGEKKINSGTLFPYDIFEKMGLTHNWIDFFSFTKWDRVLEEQWKALPNYVSGENNVLIMADTSGSMQGRPICTSLGLAVYFAERNKGAFKDMFMTFSRKPSFITLKGTTLKDKIKSIPAIVANTNLESAFDLVLTTAVEYKVPAEEMPKAIIVISDMEIDACTDVRKWTFYDAMKDRFARYGYEIPTIVFWNVDSRHDVFHSSSNYKGVMLASGQSPSVFRAILDNIGTTPYEAMLKVLNKETYSMITV